MADRPDSPLAARVCASPNHGDRKEREIDSLILHYTGMPTSAGALAWLCNPAAQVSCHYFVEEDGTILQLVPEARRAWHAGASKWKLDDDINSGSIGVEIVNPGHDGGLPPFPDPQIEAVIALCRDICARNGIAPERVLAHSDVAPARKIDPGEKFPWDRLAAHGVGHWVEPAPIIPGPSLAKGAVGPDVAALRAALSIYGYDLAITVDYDADMKTVVSAFQRHFRPGNVDGVADVSTRDTLRRLIAALPPRVA
jgi:N-acetylmuramoyl-L-alanine amidase